MPLVECLIQDEDDEDEDLKAEWYDLRGIAYGFEGIVIKSKELREADVEHIIVRTSHKTFRIGYPVDKPDKELEDLMENSPYLE